MGNRLVNGEVVSWTAEEEAAFEAARTPTLGQARKAKKADIKSRWEKAAGTFPYLGARYDVSALAGRIAVLANAARQSGNGFPVRFVSEEDTEVSLSRAEMQTFETALATHLQACSANAKALRDAVQAAATSQAVLAIDIEAGWP